MEAQHEPREVYLHKPAPPCAINCLPIEILAMIFTFVGVSKIPLYSPRNTTFPFNVAATCIFWMEILKSNPENWKSISIDVMDPTPFLDTFSIFTGGPIEVYVFSGARKKASRGSILAGISVEDARKSHENRQTQIIFGQLEPHCKRCVSITFDLVFQSSLPCTTSILARSLPCLEKLVLKCQIHDMDDEDESMDETYIDEDKLEVETPLLKEISLPGYSFMQFGRLSQELRTMIGENLLSLSIDHLTLHKDEIGVHDNIQTFVGFMDSIESLNCDTLNLSNITFGYRPRPRNKEYTFLGRQVSLVNVSAEFISAFFGCVTMDDLSVLHITRSSIPFIAHPIMDRISNSHLVLQDIPFQEVSFFPPLPKARAIPMADKSIYNAIELFAFSHLYLVNCEGVGDDFFEWLSGDDGYAPAFHLQELWLDGCNRFTSGALRDFIGFREDIGRPLVAIEVSGKGPMISRSDLAWFLGERRTATRVTWNVEADTNEDFVADLRPVGGNTEHK